MPPPDLQETTTLRGEVRALWRMALPFAIAQAGQSLMALVDTAVVGRIGAVPLAGAALGNTVFFALTVLGIGLLMGLDPLTAQAVGAKDRGRARRLLWQGLWLSIASSGVLLIPLLLSPLAFPLFGIDHAVCAESTRFLYWRLPGLFPMLLYFGVRSYLQAEGHVAVLAWSTGVANVLNFLTDLLFVFGGAHLPAWSLLRWVPAMGSAGAAISTDLCMVFQVVWLIVAAARIRVDGHTRAMRRPHRADLRTATRIGIPVGLQMGAEVGVFALAGLFAGHFGATSVAAHQIALMFGSLTFCVAVGVGSAGSVRVGWAVGAGRHEAARRTGFTAFASAAAFMSLTALAFWFLPHLLARLMTTDPSVLAATVPLLAIAAVFQIFDGVQGAGAGVLRGYGDTQFTFRANVFGHYAIGLPLALFLAFSRHLGVTGLWWGLCAGLIAVALGLLARFVRLSARPVAALA